MPWKENLYSVYLGNLNWKRRAPIVRPLCFYLRSVVRDIKDFINAFDERVIQWFFSYTGWIESIASLSEWATFADNTALLPSTSEVCNVAWSEILGGKYFSCNMSCVLVVTNKTAPAVDVGENSTYSITGFFFTDLSCNLFFSLLGCFLWWEFSNWYAATRVCFDVPES